jgi:tetratricopeptide (TPR) repeat protein
MLIQNLADLRELIDKMDRNEKLLLRSYLKAFDSRQKGYKPMGLVLFDLLQRHADNEKVVRLLRAKVARRSDDAIRMIISRLRDKAIQVYVLEVNLERRDVFEAFSAAKLEVKRLRHGAHILLSRGSRKLADELAEKAIFLAKRYELWTELPDLLQFSHEVKRVGNSMSEFQKNLAAVEGSITMAERYLRTELGFSRVMKSIGMKGLNRKRASQEYLSLLKGFMVEWKGYHDDIGSVLIANRINQVEAEYHQMMRDYDAAAEALSRSIQIADHPALNTKGRLTSLKYDFAENEILRFRFVEARQRLFEVLSMLPFAIRRWENIKEGIFKIGLYLNDFEEAEASIIELLADVRPGVKRTYYARYSYLKACLLFLKGDHRGVNRALTDAAEIAQDREGWNVAMRVLRIMNSIESEDFDLADAQITAFYQFVREGLKDSGLRERDSMILHVLMDLRKSSYDFRAVADTSKNQIDNLWKADGDTAWDVLTPELVVFHPWFAGKAEGSPFPIPISRESVYR